ncbi:hypothetical protein [Streptomyces sp. 769]|uniref:hypothetical protein n=1 Tax=Streptomyces sp. 769 TaxID=1262452 RepID=UPI001EF159B3|nr:hypothetical protein [Streptomyces sp. 769]
MTQARCPKDGQGTLLFGVMRPDSDQRVGDVRMLDDPLRQLLGQAGRRLADGGEGEVVGELAGRQLQGQRAQHPVPVGPGQVQVTGGLQIEQDQVPLLVPPEGSQRREGGFDVVSLLLGQKCAPASRAGPPLQRFGGCGEGRHGGGRFGQVQHDFAGADHHGGQRRQLPVGGGEMDCGGTQGTVEHGGVQGRLSSAQVLLGGCGPVFRQGDAAAAVAAALLEDAAGGEGGQESCGQDAATDRGRGRRSDTAVAVQPRCRARRRDSRGGDLSIAVRAGGRGRGGLRCWCALLGGAAIGLRTGASTLVASLPMRGSRRGCGTTDVVVHFAVALVAISVSASGVLLGRRGGGSGVLGGEVELLSGIDQVRVLDLLAIGLVEVGPPVTAAEFLVRDLVQRVPGSHGVRLVLRLLLAGAGTGVDDAGRGILRGRAGMGVGREADDGVGWQRRGVGQVRVQRAKFAVAAAVAQVVLGQVPDRLTGRPHHVGGPVVRWRGLLLGNSGSRLRCGGVGGGRDGCGRGGGGCGQRGRRRQEEQSAQQDRGQALRRGQPSDPRRRPPTQQRSRLYQEGEDKPAPQCPADEGDDGEEHFSAVIRREESLPEAVQRRKAGRQGAHLHQDQRDARHEGEQGEQAPGEAGSGQRPRTARRQRVGHG